MSKETEVQADRVVQAVKSYVSDVVDPCTKRLDKMESELASARTTIATLQQKLSSAQKELSALTRRALKKSS